MLPADVTPVSGILNASFFFPINQGWFGFGLPNPATFKPGQSHLNTDMLMFEIMGSNVLATDRFSVENGLPPLDTSLGGKDNLLFGTQGVAGTSTKYPQGVMFVRFLRNFVTGDPLDQSVVVLATQPCMFAFSDLPGLSSHGRQFEFQTCNFGNVGINNERNFELSLIVAHGVLGSLGLGLFVTFGAFLYRYLFCVPDKTLSMLSNIMFVFGGLLVLISFIIAVAMVSNAQVVHFSFDSASMGAHAITSLVATLGIFVFLVLRLLLDCVWSKSKDDESEGDSSQMYKLGAYAGWAILFLTVIVGWACILLGFVDERLTDPWLWVIGGIIIGIAVIFALAEIIRCVIKPADEDEPNVEMEK